MIVLDEELQGLGLEEAIAKWYRGSVSVVKQLRPGTCNQRRSDPDTPASSRSNNVRDNQSH
jgi:hypothetical protein